MSGRDIADTPPDDSILAAEYSLGLIDEAERLVTERRMRRDRAFAELVHLWDLRFAALFGMAIEAAPPDALKARIDRALFGASPKAAAIKRSIFDSLVFWRWASIGLAMLSAVLIAVALRPAAPHVAGPQRLIAALAPTDAATLAFVSIDVTGQRLNVSGLNVDPGVGDAELWAIPPGRPPRSLGLLDRGPAVAKSLNPDLMALLAEGVTLAISLEPKGGSPTGAPTGPVVAIGPLKRF